MVVPPIGNHLRSGIFLRSTCFVRVLRNPFEGISANCFSIMLFADVIRSEKKMHIIIAMSSIRIIIGDDITDTILFVDHISSKRTRIYDNYLHLLVLTTL